MRSMTVGAISGEGVVQPVLWFHWTEARYSSHPPLRYKWRHLKLFFFYTLLSLHNYLILCPLLFPAVLLRSFATLHSLLFLPLRLLLQLQLRLQTPPEVQQPVPELLVLGPQALHLRGQLPDNGGIQTSTQSIAEGGYFLGEEANLLLLVGQTCSQALRHL